MRVGQYVKGLIILLVTSIVVLCMLLTYLLLGAGSVFELLGAGYIIIVVLGIVKFLLIFSLFSFVYIYFVSYKKGGLQNSSEKSSFFRRTISFSVVLASAVSVIAVEFFVDHALAGWGRYLVSGDHDQIKAPVSAGTIAIRRESMFFAGSRGSDPALCHGFCLHALLSGKVDRVLIVETDELVETPAPKERAIAFSIERADRCPDVALLADMRWLRASSRKQEHGYTPGVTDTMRIRMMSGECLVARTATLDEADVVITIRKKKDDGSALQMKWLFYDRVTVHLRNAANGNYREIFRWTGVEYYPINVIPFLLLFPRKINYTETYQGVNFVVKDIFERLIGISFVLDSQDYERKVLDRIDAVLRENRSPTTREWKVFSDYFASLDWASDVQMKTRRRRLDVALRMLRSSHFPPLLDLDDVVAFALKSSSGVSEREMAHLLLKKMDSVPTWQKVDTRTAYLLRGIVRFLAGLSKEALKADADLLLKVLGRKAVRINANDLFFEAGFLGDRLLPLLQRTLDEAVWRRRERQFWEGSRLINAALKGLCTIGKKGTPMAGRLLALMKTGELSLTESKGDSGRFTLGYGLITTLLRMGVSPDEITAHLPADGREKGERYLEDVLRDWKRGKKGLSLCRKYL